MSTLPGQLTTFEVGPFLYPIFTSGDLSSSKAILFIGGLTNGLGAVPYTYSLSEAVGKAGWKFIQFHWSSAYGGYGTGSLNRDRSEMELLVKHLRSTGITTLVLMGHSTGSQNVMHYISNPALSSSPELQVEGGIMQASVSDREFFHVLKMTEYDEVLPEAERLVKEGQGEKLMSEEFCKKAGFGGVELKINAYRTWSLAGVGGDDDYFSSDIPAEPTEPYVHSLKTSFGALSAPVLALYSEKDAAYQVAPPEELLPRWEAVSNGKLEWKILQGASHDVKEPEAQEILKEEVLGWIKRFK